MAFPHSVWKKVVTRMWKRAARLGYRRTASFRFFLRCAERGGDVLQDWSDDDRPGYLRKTQLSAGSDDQNQLVEVVLQSSVTTTGTLALY